MKNLLLASLAALTLVISHPAGFAHAQTPVGSGTGSASITFSPAGGTVPVGQEFNVTITVNTGGQQSAGADVTVKYETSKLDFVSGTYPDSNSFYPNNRIIYPIAANSGKISMARTVSTSGGDIAYTTGSGTFAVLTFKAKSGVQIGDTTTLSFEYTQGASNDFTNVANATTPVADLLGTSTLPTATYTFGSGTPVGDGPVINSIAPSSGSAKNTTRVTINGANFGAQVAGESKVYLGTKLVNIISWTDTQIVVEVAAEPDLVNDSVRQVKVHRADGQEATYLGFRLIASGPEVFIWGGITLMALLLTWFAYRKMSMPVMAMSTGAGFAPVMDLPVMNYSIDNPVSQITYRNQ